jgi:hypothetical protein
MVKKIALQGPRMTWAIENNILYYKYGRSKEWHIFTGSGTGSYDPGILDLINEQLADKADKFELNNIVYNLSDVYSELKTTIEGGMPSYDIFACDRAVLSFRIDNNLL